jgi:cell division protein FtsW
MRPRVRQAAFAVGRIDGWLMLAFLGLMFIGVLMVYSASIADAYAYYGSPYYMLIHQLIYAAVGFIALILVARLDYHRWDSVALLLFAMSVLLLAAVLVPHVGHASHGARRWLSLGGGITVEPSELVKLGMVLYMASWLASKGSRIRDFEGTFVPFSLMLGLVAFLIVRQPDLGTTIVVVATMLALYFVAGADFKHMALLAAGSSLLAWLEIGHVSYRTDRLTAFMDPWKDPTGVGYHTIQALLALGSGGLYGRGLGNSTQKYVLPAPHTDSILAVIGEEWGLVGTLGILLLFVIIAYRGIRISMTAPDTFGKLLAAGLTYWISFQALMNFGVITSSVPFTGVPLPFVSYGGTSLIITMAAIGILLNISRHATKESPARDGSHNGWRDRGPRLPRVVDHPVPQRNARARPRVRSSPQTPAV